MAKILHNPSENRESGVTLPIVALMLVTLLGISAFAIDLGWFYLNSSRIQRAADAGALGGVIWMPGNFGQASVSANEITQTNDYQNGVDSATVLVEAVINQPHQLRVTVTDIVPTFFLKVFGMTTQTIRRAARAEYIPPLPMGSPSNQFGNSCDPVLFTGCGDNFWANIHGRDTDTIMGDAYSSRCRGSNGNSSCTLNTLWRDRGYLYGVEANGNSSFTVEVNDLVFRNISGGQTTSDYIRTGDRGCEAWGNNAPGCGPRMEITLWAPDPTPLDLTDNGAPICQQTLNPTAQVAPGAAYGFSAPAGCFTVNSPTSGIYPLQIRVLDSGGNDDGLNRYSLRTMPSTTKMFALGDMSIYNNSSGTTTAFHLAEVSSNYSGKTFVVELYDPGESSQTGTLQVIDPSGGVFTTGTGGVCRIYSRNNTTLPWTLQSTPANCQESVSPGEYNGRWLKFEMVLPASYSCTTCWWKMNYSYPSAVNDTTTWRAYIEGNPIHLVPN